MDETAPKDLLLLVPDKNTHFALKGALSRHEAMAIRPITFDFLVHPGRDGGVRTGGVALASLKRRQFRHLLLIFDHEGSGAELDSIPSLTADLARQLLPLWGENARVIILDPEVDVWMWGSDSILRELLQWKKSESMRTHLKSKGYRFNDQDKPIRPKEALEEILWLQREPRSSSLYEKIAQRTSLKRCQDPAFLNLRETLQLWFPP